MDFIYREEYAIKIHSLSVYASPLLLASFPFSYSEYSLCIEFLSIYHSSIIMLVNILCGFNMILVLQILMNVWKDFITVLKEQRSVLTVLEALNVNVLQDT